MLDCSGTWGKTEGWLVKGTSDVVASFLEAVAVVSEFFMVFYAADGISPCSSPFSVLQGPVRNHRLLGLTRKTHTFLFCVDVAHT
jgi:hypothetical protein